MELFFVFILGLAFGSFLNVLIDRLPKGESIWFVRSRCDHCKKTLRWYELFPVFSFLMQRGRCRRCHKSLSLQYPAVELVTGFVFLIVFGQSSLIVSAPMIRIIGALSQLLIASSLLVIFVADLKYQVIPDSMVALGVLGVLLQGHPLQMPQGPAFWVSALGASSFLLSLWLVTRGRGMGLGDVKLAFLLGLLLGYPKIVIAFYLAFLTGAVVGVTLILQGSKTLKSKVPFGPFLIAGSTVAMFWGTELLQWWFHLW